MQSRAFSTRILALLLALLLAQPLSLMAQGAAPQLPNPGTTGMNRQQTRLSIQFPSRPIYSKLR